MKNGLIATVVGGLVAASAAFFTPAAGATTRAGNFNLIIPDRFDFHTWVWSINPCANDEPTAQCLRVLGIAQPIAKAFNYAGDAHFVDRQYALTVDDPFGLRCGNVYYGPTSTTHDVYSWDAITMAGTLMSSFDAGCDGAPGTLTYPISLSRM